MPYKDKEKQKEAKKEWARRKRAKGSTCEGSTSSQSLEPITGTSATILPPDDELFAGVPEPCRVYANGELGGDWYKQLIHKLKTSTIDQLKTEGVFIPCWRYSIGQEQT